MFIDHPSYVREGTPYGDGDGAYGDNLFRFALLSLVACEVPLQLELGGEAYGDKCVFVANDWHASLVCVYVASKYRPFNGAALEKPAPTPAHFPSERVSEAVHALGGGPPPDVRIDTGSFGVCCGHSQVSACPCPRPTSTRLSSFSRCAVN